MKAELDVLLFFVFAFGFIAFNEFTYSLGLIPLGEENSLVYQERSSWMNMISGLGSFALIGGGLYYASEIYGLVYGYPKFWVTKIKKGVWKELWQKWN